MGTVLTSRPILTAARGFDDGKTIALHGIETSGQFLMAVLGLATGTVVHDVPGSGGFDVRPDIPPSGCGQWAPCDDCVRREAARYPIVSRYSLLGPNSNTFVGTIQGKCSTPLPPLDDLLHAPGWAEAPPPYNELWGGL